MCNLSCGRVCFYVARVCVFERGVEERIRPAMFTFLPCENDNEARLASHLPLWLASCVPPVRRLSLISRVLSSPPFLLPPPVFVLASNSFSQAVQILRWLTATHKNIYNKERGGGGGAQKPSLAGHVSCLRMLLYDTSGKSEPTQYSLKQNPWEVFNTTSEGGGHQNPP